MHSKYFCKNTGLTNELPRPGRDGEGKYIHPRDGPRPPGIIPAASHIYGEDGPPGGAGMTRQLEDTIDSLGTNDALRVLDAVDGTLDALRQDALSLGETPEIKELVRRIDAYKGHLDRQRSVLLAPPASPRLPQTT